MEKGFSLSDPWPPAGLRVKTVLFLRLFIGCVSIFWQCNQTRVQRGRRQACHPLLCCWSKGEQRRQTQPRRRPWVTASHQDWGATMYIALCCTCWYRHVDSVIIEVQRTQVDFGRNRSSGFHSYPHNSSDPTPNVMHFADSLYWSHANEPL